MMRGSIYSRVESDRRPRKRAHHATFPDAPEHANFSSPALMPAFVTDEVSRAFVGIGNHSFLCEDYIYAGYGNSSAWSFDFA